MIRSIRPRLVTFDVTGTLLMTKLEEHYTEIGIQHGLSVDPRKLARSFKSNFQRLAIEHPIYGKHTGLGWENWWRMIVHDVFKEQHRYVPQTTLDKVANSLIKCYSTRMCWHKYPGTIELLEYLRERNLILGVISNFDERLNGILVDTGIRSYFSFVLTSYDLGVEKPNRAIFDEALRLTTTDCQNRGVNKVEPSEAIHVGDTVDNDYFGAKRAGWNAILISHGDEKERKESRVPQEDSVANLTELQRHFRELLNVGLSL